MAQANLKLLGEAIRRFREQAHPTRMSLFRLATLMQWEGTAPIIEIEKGRRRPRPETLNALGEALQLSPADIAYLHGLAGYRAGTVMPPIEQIKRVLQAIEPDLAHRLYPVYVLDFQFRHWMVNPATAALVGGSLDTLTELMRRAAHGFDVVFDSRLPVRQYFSDPEAVELERMFRFKLHNLYRRHEPFYLVYPECMKHQLLPEDYGRFVKCWNEVEVGMHHVFPVHPHIKVRLGADEITFVIHMVELLHLDRLLYVGYYEPKDDGSGNRERCEAYFTRYGPGNKACIRAWDFRNDGPPVLER
jgi:transcriptional regulator with XRE-family HTH domain